LLEKAANGIFTVNVGNIAVNQEITIELEYITELECTDEGEMKFVLPTNISPKYDAPEKTVTDIIVDQATTSQLTYSSSVPFQFQLNINWQSNSRIKRVHSLTNEIEVSGIHQKMVNIQSKTAPSKGDFNLFLQTETIGPSIYLHKHIEQGETFLMLTNRIKEEIQEIGKENNEFLISLDRSGSMGDPISGWSGAEKHKNKMDLAKEVAELFLQSLPPNSFFNIISFGSNYEAMFARSVPYTDENKHIALTKVSQFTANFGRTELFPCLSDVLSGKLRAAAETVKQEDNDFKNREWTPRSSSDNNPASPEDQVIILITDGQVNNQDAMTNLLNSFNHKYRVFSIGIGQDVDRHLITEIGKSSNAKSEIILDNPDVTTAVVKMLDSASKHYYTSTVMKINEKLIQVDDVIYPNQFHHFFHKMPTVLFEEAVSVTELTSFDGLTGKNVSWNHPVNESITNNHSEIIRQLYAANLIKELEKTNHNNQNTAKIIQLSVKYHIMNDKTSFVVVDEQKNNNGIQFKPETVIVPPWSGGETSTRMGGLSLGTGIGSSGGSIFLTSSGGNRRTGMNGVIVLSTSRASKGNSGGIFLGSGGGPASGRGGAVHVKVGSDDSGAEDTLIVRGGQSSGKTGGVLSLSSGVGFATMSGDVMIPTGQEMGGLSGAITLGGPGSSVGLSMGTGIDSDDRGGSGDSGIGAPQDSGNTVQVDNSGQVLLQSGFTAHKERTGAVFIDVSVIPEEMIVGETISLRMGGRNAEIIELRTGVGSKPIGSVQLEEDSKETSATQHNEQDECLQIKSGENSEKTFEIMLKLKRVDGSFIRNCCSLHLLGESASNYIAGFSRYHELTEEIVFQLFILKKWKDRNEKKFVMIVRNLESWFQGQDLHGVPLENWLQELGNEGP
jgi:hypothetical protein